MVRHSVTNAPLQPVGVAQRTGLRVPAWLFDWTALKDEYDRVAATDPSRAGNLLYPALKLARDDNESAQLLNCIAHDRARGAKNLDDLHFALTGFLAALDRARDQELLWKIKVNLAWSYNMLGVPKQAEAWALGVFLLLPPAHALQYAARYNLGLAWASRGEYARASSAFQSLLPFAEPGTVRHANAVTWLASLALYQGRPTDCAEQVAALPAQVCSGATWILRSVLALDENRSEANDLALNGIRRIELSALNWQERFNLALGYRVLAANAYGATRNHLCRIADHFAGTVRPRWVYFLFDYVAAREGDPPE